MTMSAKTGIYKKLGILTATVATILCSFCFAMAILQEGIRQVSTEGWLIMGAGIFVLMVVWFIVIVMLNE